MTKVIIAGKIPQKAKTAATRLMHTATTRALLVSMLQIDGKQGKQKWAARNIGRSHLLFVCECAFACALVRGALQTKSSLRAKEFTARKIHLRTCKAFILCFDVASHSSTWTGKKFLPSPDVSQRESVLSLSQSEGGGNSVDAQGVREGHLRALEAERSRNKLLEMKVAAYERRIQVGFNKSQTHVPLNS